MRVFQQSSNPLKTARIRQFLYEGAQSLPAVAGEFVPGLIHISLILFFWGFGDLIFQIDITIFITTLFPILICVFIYIYCVIESNTGIPNLALSDPILRLHLVSHPKTSLANLSIVAPTLTKGASLRAWKYVRNTMR